MTIAMINRLMLLSISSKNSILLLKYLKWDENLLHFFFRMYPSFIRKSDKGRSVSLSIFIYILTHMILNSC